MEHYSIDDELTISPHRDDDRDNIISFSVLTIAAEYVIYYLFFRFCSTIFPSSNNIPHT